jgi:hypothetical protein
MVASTNRLRWFTSASIVGALVAACTPVVPPNATNADRICDALCARRTACGAGENDPTCQESCRDPKMKVRAYWRADYVEAASACIARASCNVSTEEVEGACLVAARPEPSDTARRACRIFEAKQRECIGAPEDVGQCLDGKNWRVFSDPVLEEFIACEGQHCGANSRKMCVDGVLGVD